MGNDEACKSIAPFISDLDLMKVSWDAYKEQRGERSRPANVHCVVALDARDKSDLVRSLGAYEGAVRTLRELIDVFCLLPSALGREEGLLFTP